MKELSHIDARDIRPMPFGMDDAANYRALESFGIGFDSLALDNMAQFGMDATQSGVLGANIPNPVQFLQTMLTGMVKVVTQVRNIDELVGVTTVGNWEGEEVVQTVAETTGKARPYGDSTGLPLSSYGINFERRTIVRFENGIRVSGLEAARASALKVNAAALKREAAANSLEIQRNAVGFTGFNSGANRTYGFLNDPNLPAYVGVAGGLWSAKTFDQITVDIRTAVSALILRSGGNVDPEKINTTLAIPTNLVPYLSVTTTLGMSVRDWISKTYPKMRIVSAPELYLANGGASVFYLYAEKMPNVGSDDGRTFVQAVPTKFNVLGAQKNVKNYEEGYTNATAGVFLKYPVAVVRYTGI